MRTLILTLLAVALPSIAFAAWPETWSTGTASSSGARLVIPSNAQVGDYSDDVRCGGEQGCMATVNGDGSYDLVVCTGVDCTDVTTAAANFSGTGVTLSEGTQVLDMKRNRVYRFLVNSAPTGSGIIVITSN